MFKFRLASVLRLRKYKENIRLEQVGRCISQLQAAELKKEEINHKIQILEDEYAAYLKGVISSEKINWYRNYIFYQQNLLKLQEEIILEKRKNLEVARQNLVEAMKDRKILDKLQEKQYLRYQQEEGKKEQILQDELAAVASKRR